MSFARTFATARRALGQLQHDPRSLGLLLVVPVVLMGLIAWIFPTHDVDRYGPPLLGIFPLLVMFLVTSVATLRERTSGTLERLLTMPLAKADFIFGYAVAFGALAIVQAVLVSGVSFGLYGLKVQGSAVAVGMIAVTDALLGTALGLFVSAFASTEFQAVQFMPVILIPQLLLCGLLLPTDQLPTVLGWLSYAMPMRYAVSATTVVMTSPTVTASYWVDLGIVAAFAVGFLALGAATLRRRTP
ncbi:MAG TPA: ABC transporter permease [Actinomycetota bacterium]|nr:ABC transporter permease [Actinomycetota bacterium]